MLFSFSQYHLLFYSIWWHWDLFRMEKINFGNNLLINILITELSRHRFCRWQTVDEALIGTNATYTYPKTLLINDFRRIALPS